MHFYENTFFRHANKLIKEKIFTSKFRESRNNKGILTFLDKKKSLKIIQNQFFIDLNNKKKKKLIDIKILKNIYEKKYSRD